MPFLLILLLGMQGERSARQPMDDVKVVVGIQGSGESERIAAQVTNLRKKDIVVYPDGLPWGNFGFEIVALPTAPCAWEKPVTAGYTVQSPPFGKVVIKPGQTVKGDVLTAIRLPNLAEVRGKCDVLVFWSYQLVEVDHTWLQRVGGWFLLPKRGK